MMEQAQDNPHVGTVVAVDETYATVRFTRTAMCKDCGACLAIGDKELEQKVANSLGAQVGDRVSISIPGRRVLQASVIAYIIPLAFLLSGVMLGSQFSELWSLILGVVACGLAYLVLHFLEKRRKKENPYLPQMVSIVSRGERDAS